MSSASLLRSRSSSGAGTVAALAASLAFSGVAPQPLRGLDVRMEDDRLYGVDLEEDGHFGSRLAMSRSAGNSPFAVAGGPHAAGGGEMALFQYQGNGQWGIDFSLLFLNAETLPVDLESGVALYADRLSDGTTTIRSLLGNGDGDEVETGIAGAVGAIAVDWDFFDGVLAIGQPDFSLESGRVLIYEGTFGGEFTLVHSFAGGVGDRLGESLAMCQGVLVAGRPGEGANGAVEVYLRTTEWTGWQQLASPAVSQTDAAFGDAVAISEDCRWIAVGSPKVDRAISPGFAVDIGAVYLYESSFFDWEERGFLRPAGARELDRFGTSVAMHGHALVAGSPGRDESQENQGAAYVYHLSGPVWREHLQLIDGDGDEDDLLGASVAIGELGALVGAPQRDAFGLLDSGMANFYAGVFGLFFDGFESGDRSSWSDSLP